MTGAASQPVPSRARAALCRQYGPPEDLVVTEVDVPAAGPGQALVRVAVAAVNYPDVLFLQDKYQVSVPPPFVPGSEFSGEVVAVGEGTTGVEVGDRVFGAVMVGAFAEYVVADAAGLMPVPPGVDHATAAGFWVVYSTAYHALRSVAQVQPGETVLVLGAAGGVGLASVEVAKLLGAKVVAAASTPEKLELCLARGADHAVNYTSGDLRKAVKEATGGVDVVIDPVGGSYAETALRCANYDGRFVTIGFASGEIPRIPLNLVLLKGVRVMGMEIRGFMENHPDLVARDKDELLGYLAAGRIRPHVGAVYPLEDTGAALRCVADRRALGKVLIDVGGA